MLSNHVCISCNVQNYLQLKFNVQNNFKTQWLNKIISYTVYTTVLYRVSLARAAYANSDVVLLDDPLSAVDSHVGEHIFKHLILGFLSGRTRILVTHNLALCVPRADMVVCLSSEGSAHVCPYSHTYIVIHTLSYIHCHTYIVIHTLYLLSCMHTYT